MALEQLPGPRIEHRTAAEGEDTVVAAECVGDGFPLECAERGLAVVDEDLLDGLAGPRLDGVVAVEEANAQGVGEQPADRRLARTHGADEHGRRLMGLAHLYLNEAR